MKKIDSKYFIQSDRDKGEMTIDSVLTPDEEVLWRGKPLKKSFVLSAFFKFLPFALIWLFFDIMMIVLISTQLPSIPLPVIIFLVFFFALHLIPVWIWVANLVSAGKRQELEEYAFTGERIIVKKGFIGANVQSFPYSSLTSINLKIGLVEKLCKVGDIYIVCQNQKVVLEDLPDAPFLYSRLQKIANDIKSDILYPNALRPGENPGYKTSYKGEEIRK